VNPDRSWRKLKLGYHPNNLWNPKLDVVAGGNNTLCITMRVPQGVPEWNKIQVRPQASAGNAVILANHIPQGGIGNTWTTICIPVSAFNGFNFTQISYFEFPFSNGANPFEIHVKKMEFTGGTTPFLWFGDNKTDNYHDGQSGTQSALIASLVPGQACGGAKLTEDNEVNEGGFFINAYPNPFREKLNIDFTLPETSNVHLEIYNLTGQLLGTIYKGEAKANELVHTEFNPADIPSGMILYRLQNEDIVKHGKVLVQR
jgi:hypothetical protein